MFHPDILRKIQLQILERLAFPRNSGFYMAGGTALALQLGHRRSIDFDFYSRRHFRSDRLFQDVKKLFPSASVSFQEENTLRLEILGTELSFFSYDYPLILPLRTFRAVRLASPPDIAAMKIAAIIQRGTRRDFIDIYYLLRHYSLEELIQFTLKKYSGYQVMLILRALIYFEDAEKDKEKNRRALAVLDKNFSWEQAKRKIVEEVKEYQLRMLKA